MENRGFEEEHQSRVEEGTVLLSQPSLRNSRSFSYRPSRGDVFSVSASNPDNHVYEDILPGVEDVSRPSNGPSDRDPGRSDAHGRRSVDVVDRVSTGSFDREEIGAAGLRRNLTLPFRRGTGLDSAIASSSVRVTSREKYVRQENAEVAAGIGAPVDDAFSSREVASRTQSSDCRPNRRRRKKDCKHCRSKQASRDHEASDHGEIETVLKRNRDNEQRVHAAAAAAAAAAADSTDPDPRNIGIPPPCSPVPTPEQLVAETGKASTTVFTISEQIEGSPASTMKLIEYERSDVPANLAHSPEIKEDKALIASEKSRNGMRVNSIYSQDRWYAKEPPIFFTDVKEHGSFQRAYSLPVRTQTPSSQNRANLRRSVRGEPPPHPARLRKHRHGWTLHLARPLESSGCTRSLVFLLILVLALLGIGAVALYIVFEPEKLQIIQQYLRSSTNSSSGDDAKTFIFGDGNETTSTTPVSNTLVGSVLSSIDPSFPEISSPTATEPETTAGPSNLNSTRYCDDCLDGEVCVALVDEEVPICRIGLDREDPTGCAGFCLINRQRCHRLDVDAFRCVEVEHYCLDDEWTCSNTLCIPLEKRCDGHMNCYDHSDEYDCVCDQETHFQCGNETSCLQLEKRCDGKIDCWDAADEINCTLGRILGRSCPSDNEFTCSDGQCILKDRFCDGLPDCLDGSDEPHGCQGRCNKQEFTCQNSRCITKGMKCNGMDDCGDGSDERHCKDRFA